MALATRPKHTTSHKKRTGAHHRHNRPYLKAYWPYLPMLMIVGAGLLINSAWSHRAVLGSSSDFSSSSLLGDTNRQRLQDHESALTINSELMAAAQAKANDMVQRDYWSHNTPDGRTPWSFITASGYQYQAAGENLAYGFSSAADTVSAWMNSPEHRANILEANYRNVGFGVASSPNYQGHGPAIVVVAEYGEPAAVISAAAPGGIAGTQAQQLANGAAAHPVDRIQLLTGGQAEWSALAVSALAGVAATLLVVRYGLYVRRFALQGESFIAHHPFLDIAVTFIITTGFVLTRPGGIIR